MDRFKSELCELGPGLSNHQFHCIKIACCLFLRISRQTLETVTTFIALYDLMKQALPHGADLLIYQILLKLDVSKSKLAKIGPHINRKHERDFIIDNPQLDLLLTVAVMLDKLSNRRYEKFRNQCVQSFLIDYHVDNITSRAALLELLADRGLLDPNDLTSLFLLFHHITSTDGSTQYIEILREFCRRQRIDEPDWTVSQLPNNMSESLICQLQVEVQLSRSGSYGSSLRGTVSSNVINESNVHYKNNKGCGFNFNIRRIIIHSVLIAVFFVICLCLLIGFGLFFTGTYFYQLTNIESNSSHQIGANSIVQLFPGQCVIPGWIKSISITVQSPLNITLYKGVCTDRPSTETHYLENKTYHRNQSFDKDLKNYCFNANYYGEKQKEHHPIYTAGHGVLSYDIQLVNASKIDESPCPLIFYLFNESYYYTYWVKTPYKNDNQQSIAEVAYAYSPCLNTSDGMNRGQNDFFNFTHDFQLEDSGFYYTLCCITVSFFSNLTISGRVTKYSEEKMEELQSCLSPNAVQGDANCTVSMGNFFDSSFNLFVETTYEPSERNITVVVRPEDWNIASIIFLLLTVSVFISSIIVIIVVISCKQKKKIKDYSALQ